MNYRQWTRQGLFSCALMLTVSATAEEAKPEPMVPKYIDMQIWKDEYKNLGDPKQLKDDAVLLSDGTLMHGKVKDIPLFVNDFANIQFDKSQVAAIEFSPSGTDVHVRIITRLGERFSGKFSSSQILFEKEAINSVLNKKRGFYRSFNKKTNYAPVKLDLHSLSAIVFKQDKNVKPYADSQFFSVELFNGDSFIVSEDDYDILLHNESGDFRLLTREIEKIEHLKGGLQGYVKDGVWDRKFPFSLLQDRHFSVRLARDGSVVQIPWQRIRRVWGNQDLLYPSKSLRMLTDKESHAGMVYIPAGMFYMGQNQVAVDKTPQIKGDMFFTKQSSHQVLPVLLTNDHHTVSFPVKMKGFYIDKYEVTNAEYKVFVEKTGHRNPAHWTNGYPPRGKENHPVVNVSLKDAQAYAKWAGKRLPTEMEWERAAKVSTSFQYPYGPEYMEERANTESISTVDVGTFEDVPVNTRKYPLQLMSGTEDMSGNVQEWTTTVFSLNWLAEIKKLGIHKSVNKQVGKGKAFYVVKGGSYKSGAATATTDYRASLHEEDFNDFTGFRCVVDARKD